MTSTFDNTCVHQSVDKASEADKRSLRVALVHDWLTGMRGGEKVLQVLCERFPLAPLFTLLHIPGTVSTSIAARQIHTSLLQNMPFAHSKYRHYLPLFPLFAELNKAGDADLIISTSHAVAKSMVKRTRSHGAFHICYVHTPMRYAWDLFDEYFGAAQVGWFASRFLFRPLVRLLQIYDTFTADRVDLFIANSQYVAERVKRIYGRNAEVLPPPVDTERFLAVERNPDDTYLVVSALVPYKRVDHAIRACSSLGRKLCIVGKGPELGSLKVLASRLGADVEFVGFVGDDELPAYYARARALLFPGIEDFGIVPVEAIASGCPVIAVGVGGILDSMTRDTAVLYTDQTAKGLTQGILEFERLEGGFVTSLLRERSQCFSKAKFVDALERTLLSVRDQLDALQSRDSKKAQIPTIIATANFD